MSTTTVTRTRTREFKVSTPRDELLARIKGHTARIPNLKPVFSDWRGIESRHVSSLLQPLRAKVSTRLQTFNFRKAKQARLEAADFALFTALWWPDAALDKLEILAYLVIWLFTWDDEIDEPTGLYSEDFCGAQTYRDHTLRFVGHCLGLMPVGADFRPQNKIVQSFDVIGYALHDAYDYGQCMRFYDEIARFMIASEDEQICRLKGEMPTLEDYWRFRLGTSAVYIGSAAGEYSMKNIKLPMDIMASEARQAVWDETNVIISITNDLLSLKKEMKLGCIDSIVPLTYATTNDVQQAIDLSVAELKESKKLFDEAAEDLLHLRKEGTEEYKQIQEYIEVQRSNCVGNLVWSLETARYSMAGLIDEDGGQTFTL